MVIVTEFASYFDDSGHPDDAEFVLVAGFVGEKSKWLQFEPEWNKALPPLTEFHGTDFLRTTKHWGKKRRRKYLSRLVSVIESHAILSLSDTVEMAAYRRVNRISRLEETMGAPYAMAGRVVCGMIREWQASHGDNCKMLVYFDDGTKHKGDLMQVLDRDAFPWAPSFSKKKDVPALQAADLLAWMMLDCLKTSVVSRQLERLVELGGVMRHRRHTEHALRDSVRRLSSEHPNVPMPRYGKWASVPIRFHTLPKVTRRRTIKD